MSFINTVSSRFEFLYGKEKVRECLDRLQELFRKYDYDFQDPSKKQNPWSQEDVVLITYGDILYRETASNGNKLQLLKSFVDEYLSDALNTIHILPFFPHSSDGGFSVIDYKKVREDLGSWEDIEDLASQYRLMADLVINHASRYSTWFENYQKGEEPGKDYFIETDPGLDLSGVTRPRNTSLLTTVKTTDGVKYVWSTFSDDQIDLNFSNPDILFEFIDIFLFYLSKGIRVIRLDAIAYLWKEIGTSCIHLKQTHEVVKLFRDIVDSIAPEVTLITETNVPFKENITYFGEGDEAHMIYQFSLPPLLLHAILTENAQYLTKWASELPDPPESCMYFNFTASHDGIGVRPLEGLVPGEEFDYLIESVKERGGFVSYKKNADGTQSPYELNITYYDAFCEPGGEESEAQMKRYLCSQMIMLSLKGVPGIYFHNLTATRNYIEGVVKTGNKRAINRKEWEYDELIRCVEDETHSTHRVMYNYKKFLKKRRAHPAFSPAGRQEVLDIADHLFAFLRIAPDGSEQILVISNITNEIATCSIRDLDGIDADPEGFVDILTGQQKGDDSTLELVPFQTVWLQLPVKKA